MSASRAVGRANYRQTTTGGRVCCAAAGCRKRVTPAALRFWGRRVYLGPVFLLVFSLQSGVTHKRTEELRKQLQAPTLSRRTLQRWRQWWLEVFPGSSFWRAGRARFAPPVDEKSLPGALLARFGQTDAAEFRGRSGGRARLGRLRSRFGWR